MCSSPNRPNLFMPTLPPPQESPAPASRNWRKIVPAALAAIIFFVGIAANLGAIHYAAPKASNPIPSDALQKQVYQLKAEVEELKQEQAMPAVVLKRYRNSIGYVYGVYKVGFKDRLPELRVRFSWTGFLVGEGLVATNRHIAQPWYKDSEAQTLIDQGATPVLESLKVFFPNLSTP